MTIEVLLIMRTIYLINIAEEGKKVSHQYVIPECNMADLGDRISRLNSVCEKLGVSPIVCETVSSEIRRVCSDDHAPMQYMRWHTVAITGESPVIAGWQFVAQISHGAEVGNVIRNLSEIELPTQYRTSPPDCDHCHLARNRTNTYVLINNETGKYRQVGSSCLRDFTGHDDPHAIASFLESLEALTRGLDEGDFDPNRMGGVSVHTLFDSLKFLAIVSAIIRECGWLGTAKARDEGGISTKERAIDVLISHSPSAISLEDEALAQSALEWGRAQAGASEYEANLRVVCASQYCDWRNLGILASVIVAYQKARTQAQNDAISQHVGEIGAKVTLAVQVTRIAFIERQYGITAVVSMMSGENSLVWFASGGTNLEEGKSYTLKGTVKAHGEYHGVKQTTLTRCKAI